MARPVAGILGKHTREPKAPTPDWPIVHEFPRRSDSRRQQSAALAISEVGVRSGYLMTLLTDKIKLRDAASRIRSHVIRLRGCVDARLPSSGRRTRRVLRAQAEDKVMCEFAKISSTVVWCIWFSEIKWQGFVRQLCVSSSWKIRVTSYRTIGPRTLGREIGMYAGDIVTWCRIPHLRPDSACMALASHTSKSQRLCGISGKHQLAGYSHPPGICLPIID